ncbi:kinetochore protein Mis12/MTW1, partial [Lecanoromycetidae sp. Uapishka_2]
MGDSSRQVDALLTEHFQYTPLSLIDDIINAVNSIIYQAIEALENGLLQIPPRSLGFARDHSSTSISIPDTDGNGNIEYPEATAEIENGVHQLETLLESTVDKSFDKFEIYTLRNILTIPDDLAPWMRLSHYEPS